MSNLTNLEYVALHNLLSSGYGDGPTPTVWAFCATGGVVTKTAASGVVASLSKKKLVMCDGSGSEATITVTAKGAAAYAAQKSAS